MGRTEIKIKSFEELQPFFKPTVKSMIHCAVQRNFLGYRHDYIVLGHTWHRSCKNCYIIRVSFGSECGKVKVKQVLYSKEQFENDIRNGLYMYHNDDYPKNDADYSKAHDRFLKRRGETNYSKSLEHLVQYILTGCSVSHQLRGVSYLRHCFSAFINLFTNRRLPVMENAKIKIKSLEELQSFFKPTVKSMIHCAVQQNFLGYRHHYIVLGHTWHRSCKNCYIIRVSFGGEYGKVKVKQVLYSKEQFENDIRNGLYMYQNDEYPKNDDDYSEAHDRFLKRKGETDYSILLKNSEHRIHYILTGCSVLHQSRGLSLSNVIDLLTDSRVPHMEFKEIKIDTFEELQSLFQPTTKSMIHCAVLRRFLGYTHHYIVLGHTWHRSCKDCYIIHISSDSKRSKGRIKQELYSKEQFENDIRNGLYMYHNDEYPKNDADYSEAHDRFLKRRGETDYSISLKNCEHLVYYILTGRSISHQLRKLSFLRRCLLDFIDLFTESKFKTLCKVVFSFLSLMGVDIYLEKKIKEQPNFSSKWLESLLLISNIGLSVLKAVGKSKLLIFDSKIVIKAHRHKIVLEMFRNIATGTCFLRFIGEIFFAFLKIMYLNREIENGIVDPKDIQREVVKAICSCVSGVIGNYVTLDFLFLRYANHSRHPKLYLIAGSIVDILLSQVVVFVLMEICFRVWDKVARYFNRPHGLGNQIMLAR